jgi:hypothetical protein
LPFSFFNIALMDMNPCFVNFIALLNKLEITEISFPYRHEQRYQGHHCLCYVHCHYTIILHQHFLFQAGAYILVQHLKSSHLV